MFTQQFIADIRAAATEAVADVLHSYGTSEGDEKAWDTRGRGRNLSERAQRALQSYKPATKEKHALGDKMQNKIAKLVHGQVTPDNHAFDVMLPNGRAIEVKTLIDQTNDKITMHPESIARKVAEAKENGYRPFTAVVDARGSRPALYYKDGIGSFRLGSMTKAKNWNELKEAVK